MEFHHDPFGYPVYVDKWVLLPSDEVEHLRVEKVTRGDGTVRYYYPTRPSFAHRDSLEFTPEEVSDSPADLEAECTRRYWERWAGLYGISDEP